MKRNNFYLVLIVFCFFFILIISNFRGDNLHSEYSPKNSEQPLELSSSDYLEYGDYVEKHGYATNTIEWSFRSGKSYIDITVYVMDDDNFDLIEYGGYEKTELSSGYWDEDEGTWTPPSSDTWYVVFINRDPDEEGTTLTYDAEFDPFDFWDWFDEYFFLFPMIFVFFCVCASAVANRARTGRTRPKYNSVKTPYKVRRPTQQAPKPQPPQNAQAIQSSPAPKSTESEIKKPKYCELCGEKLDPDAIFCPSCGNKLTEN